jgi:hypothetical protein
MVQAKLRCFRGNCSVALRLLAACRRMPVGPNPFGGRHVTETPTFIGLGSVEKTQDFLLESSMVLLKDQSVSSVG